MSRSKHNTNGATGGVTVLAASMPVDFTTTQTCRGFHVNGTGALAVTFIDNTTATINVVDGQYYPYQLNGVTSFTGTSIVALL